MLRKIILLLVASLAVYGVFAQSGTLKGTVKDPTTGEAIPFANVTVEKGGSILTGGMTDFDGNFTIKPIPSGTYTVKCSYVGYSTKQIDAVKINSDKITFLDFDITSGVQITEVEIYATPLIDPDQVSTGGSVSQEEIKKMPGRSAEAVATTVAGVYSQDGSISSIRGAREEGTVYYIDGVKVRGSTSLPKSAMADVSVITGGIPAKYGDATGGIISISTSGPSKELFGGFELMTSQYLDPYSDNLAEFVVSGPMLFKTEVDKFDSTKTNKNPIAGFFLSGNVSYTKDGYPSAVPVYKLNDDLLAEIQESPIRANPNGIGVLYNANYIDGTDGNFEKMKFNQNVGRLQSVVAGKVDFKPSSYVNITIGGTYDYQKSRVYSYANKLMNSDNNGQSIYNNGRAYIRFTQRFPDKNLEEGGTNPLIKNAFYRIQLDYSKTIQNSQSEKHKDDLFSYGHLGKFETYKINSYERTDTLSSYPNGIYNHNGFLDTLYQFTASDANPVLAEYTEDYYSSGNTRDDAFTNISNVESYGALLNGMAPESIYGLWSSPGTPYNAYSFSNNSQFRISASGSADVKEHEISIGFEFEQRSDRAFSVSPRDLWGLARQLTNFHIQELDFENPILHYDDNLVFQDSISYNRLYNPTSQSQFDYNLRDHLEMDPAGTEWLDLDSYDPSDLSLDYFSADELFNSGNEYVTYYGYDHHGNILNRKPSFAEFFTETDDRGVMKREVAPFEPTYAAIYIQDKFGFNDLVFNIGLRIDRYDANQMVPKDPYVLRETFKAGDVKKIDGQPVTHPDGVGDSYVVYVDDLNDPTAINGYRDGNNWFDANGAPIDDPDQLASASGIAPYLIDPSAKLDERAFEDFTPQITPMPRISFSFPISDVALFFAHYDVLSTRPTSSFDLLGVNTNTSRMNPVKYLFMEADARNLPNPNLKPQKTIDYEIGFQQKLNDNSSIKLSAFYREMRDMVQIINVTGAYPNSYSSFGNLDFGTVKGFSMSYDLRRSGNATIRANYTLQFANGTGSDPGTAERLISQGFGNIRFTNPFDYDQRHAIQLAVDFRFGGNVSQRPYNGPNWFGRDILSNTGVNFTLQAGSGEPYSRRNINNDVLIGTINGSRMPWTKTVNMRIDKDVIVKFGKDSDNKKEGYLNVYLDISNLLNTANIYSVYETTGNPDDDGYLTAAKFQSAISQQINEAAYRNYYSMYYENPFNFSRPRTIRLGLSFSF